MDLGIESTQVDERTWLVRVAGDVDLATAPQLRMALVDALGAGATHMVVDLTKVGFIDSTGLGVLIGARRRLPRSEMPMRIVTTDENVVRIFELTGLYLSLPIHSTAEEALAAFG